MKHNSINYSFVRANNVAYASPCIGEDLVDAIRDSIEVAVVTESVVSLSFNGIEMFIKPDSDIDKEVKKYRDFLVSSHEAFKITHEGKMFAARNRQICDDAQVNVDKLITQLKKFGETGVSMNDLVEWVYNFSRAANVVGVTCAYGTVGLILSSYCYTSDQYHKDNCRKSFISRQLLGEYIIKQALLFLIDGKCPHPSLERFCEEYINGSEDE